MSEYSEQESLLGDIEPLSPLLGADPGPEQEIAATRATPAPERRAETAAAPARDEGAVVTTTPQGRIAIRDLADGSQVDSVYRIEQAEIKHKKNGDQYLKLTFADASGRVAAVCWDGVNEIVEICKAGTIVAVQGDYRVDQRFGPQLTVKLLRAAAEDEYDPAELEDVPLFPYDELERGLDELIASLAEPHLGELVRRLLGSDTETGRMFREMPAAKVNHQAYKHGLLEHTLTVARGVAAAAEVFPGIDRDLAVAGALLHDIGKLDAYAQTDAGIEFTDVGNLQGEIPLGYYRIKRTIEDLAGFPPKLAQALLHIQLSHHGKREHGSPVEPAIREAVLVHLMDNLGGDLGAFDRIEKSLPAGAEWSQFERAIGSSGGRAFFGHSPGIRRD